MRLDAALLDMIRGSLAYWWSANEPSPERFASEVVRLLRMNPHDYTELIGVAPTAETWSDVLVRDMVANDAERPNSALVAAAIIRSNIANELIFAIDDQHSLLRFGFNHMRMMCSVWQTLTVAEMIELSSVHFHVRLRRVVGGTPLKQ